MNGSPDTQRAGVPLRWEGDTAVQLNLNQLVNEGVRSFHHNWSSSSCVCCEPARWTTGPASQYDAAGSLYGIIRLLGLDRTSNDLLPPCGLLTQLHLHLILSRWWTNDATLCSWGNWRHTSPPLVENWMKQWRLLLYSREFYHLCCFDWNWCPGAFCFLVEILNPEQHGVQMNDSNTEGPGGIRVYLYDTIPTTIKLFISSSKKKVQTKRIYVLVQTNP